MITKISKLILALLIIFLNNCEGPEGPKLEGEIYGRILTYDLSYNKHSEHSGVNVIIDGIGESTITDSSGFWIIDGISTGIYNLNFEKDGFGTNKRLEFQFVGGGRANVGLIQLQEIPEKSYYIEKLERSIGLCRSIGFRHIIGFDT